MDKLIIITEEQFKQLMKDILNERTISSPQTQESNILGDYIEQKEAARLLGRKNTWFYNMRAEGSLPSSKIGSKRYYSKSDILKILENNKK